MLVGLRECGIAGGEVDENFGRIGRVLISWFSFKFATIRLKLVTFRVVWSKVLSLPRLIGQHSGAL
jgi:hypothetical protein